MFSQAVKVYMYVTLQQRPPLFNHETFSHPPLYYTKKKGYTLPCISFLFLSRKRSPRTSRSYPLRVLRFSSISPECPIFTRILFSFLSYLQFFNFPMCFSS